MEENPHNKLTVNSSDNNHSFLEVVAGGHDRFDLPNILRDKYNLNPFFRNILDNPKHYKNIVSEGRLMYIKINDQNCFAFLNYICKDETFMRL